MPVGKVVAGLATLGLGAGVALGASGTVDLLPDTQQRLAADLVDYHVCPGEVALGTLVRGDNVLVVARDETGGWLQVRSPDDLFERVWVEAPLLVTAGPVDDVPVASCDDRDVIAAPPTGTDVPAPASPAPSPEASPTPTPSPTPAATSSPTPSAAPTTPTPTTAPTAPPTTPPPSPSPLPSPSPDPSPSPQNQPPVITALTRQHDTIYDTSGQQASCPSNGFPTTSTVSVDVTDDRGVATVRLTLSLGQTSDSVEMERSGGTWTHTIGPFGNVAAESVFTVDIVATDTDGATTEASTTITVRPCP